MADDDEYELLPRQEVENLKKELERIKKHPLGDTAEGKDILEAINNLNTNIKKLIDIFTKAEADLAKDYAENSPAESMKTIKEQNEQIAQGILAVADLIKDAQAPEQKPANQQQTRPGQFYQSNQNQGMPSTQSPQYRQESYPDNFNSQIPPPPQFSDYGMQMNPGNSMSRQDSSGMPGIPPFEEPMPDKKKGFLSRK